MDPLIARDRLHTLSKRSLDPYARAETYILTLPDPSKTAGVERAQRAVLRELFFRMGEAASHPYQVLEEIKALGDETLIAMQYHLEELKANVEDIDDLLSRS